MLLIVFVIGSMVFGWATATEAAAFGVLGALSSPGGHRHADLGELLATA